MNLAAIREAHVARCELAYSRNPAEPTGLPFALVAAGCWLVQHGWHGKACDAERATGWGPDKYRLFLAALDPDALDAEIEDGRAALFDGRRAIYRAPVAERLAA